MWSMRTVLSEAIGGAGEVGRHVSELQPMHRCSLDAVVADKTHRGHAIIDSHKHFVRGMLPLLRRAGACEIAFGYA